MKIAPFLFVLGIILSPIGNAQPVKVTVVPVRSVEALEAWLGIPLIDPARAARAANYPGRLDRLPPGKKALLPIVVTGLPAPATPEIRLVADVEIVGADGKSLASSPRCCRATVGADAKSGAVLLDHWVIVEPEAGGSGSYTVRVSVTDGTSTWKTTETLPYGEGDMPGSAHEVPRLRMNVPASQLERGGPGDKRDCLSLPTPSEVIKCSERK